MLSRLKISPVYLVAVIVAVFDSLLIEASYSDFAAEFLFTAEPYVATVASALLVAALVIEMRGKRLFTSPAATAVFSGSAMYLIVSVPILVLYFADQMDLLDALFGTIGDLTLWLGRLAAVAMVAGIVMLIVDAAQTGPDEAGQSIDSESAGDDDATPPKRARWRVLTRMGGLFSILAVVEPLVTVALLFSAGFSGMLTNSGDGSGFGGALLFLAIANLVIGPAMAILGLVLALVGALIGARGSAATTTRPRSLVWWGIGLAASALLVYWGLTSGNIDFGVMTYVFFASVIGGALVIAG